MIQRNGALAEGYFHRDIYCLLGLPFDAVNLADAERHIRTAVENRSSCFLSTPNLNFLIAAQSDTAFRDSVVNSDLSIPDGMPVIWLARLLGIPIRERVAGSDLFDRLMKGTSPPLSVFFFGGIDGVAGTACTLLNTQSSGLVCVGFESPGFGSVEDMSHEETISKINACNPDFVVVSLGAKKGQAWIERNRRRLSAPVISHLGAVSNFVAGTLDRAPQWTQNIGLEWLWRIKEEPKLWRRYLADGLALLSLLVTRVFPYVWYLQRHQADADEMAAARVEIRDESEYTVVGLRGAWTRSNIMQLRECFSKVALTGKDVRLEMEEVTYVDSAFVGLVTLLHGYLRQHDRRLVIFSMQEPVRRVIRYCCAEYLCPSAAWVWGRRSTAVDC